ncbi:MAG: hypothetical protein V5B40_06815 [Candidatus Accumulibacter meliphilus]|uniref:hypothetical protein n=1 Tax=Candidatus Accumulibacter TaxID=327159 RepID=UPI0019EF402C|nr:hypothetical protein [Candidatus Accumulibacter sp. ACC012]MBE2241115.1 hypothetical protein [Burkholderiaceae bacterium]
MKFAESLHNLQLSEASPSSRTYDGQMEIMIMIGATASGHRLRLTNKSAANAPPALTQADMVVMNDDLRLQRTAKGVS